MQQDKKKASLWAANLETTTEKKMDRLKAKK